MQRAFSARLVVTLMAILAASGIAVGRASVVLPVVAILALAGIIAWHRSALGALISFWIVIVMGIKWKSMLAGAMTGDAALIGILVLVAILGASWAQRLSHPAPVRAPALRRRPVVRPQSLVA